MKHRFGFFLTIMLFFVLMFASVCDARQQELSGRIIRLHVIANSDSAADQALKLRVRDRVLAVTEPLLRGADSPADVRQRLSDHLQEITDAGAQVLREADAPYSLSAQLAGEYYPTRTYDTFSLPAGEYVGLKLRLGQADGRNWWCVVFPPLCTSAAEAPDSALCEQTTFRFKTAEWLGALRARIRG